MFEQWQAERIKAKKAEQKDNEKKKNPKFKVEVEYREVPDKKDGVRQLWDLHNLFT